MRNAFVRKFPASVTVILIAARIALSYYSGLNLAVFPVSFFIAVLAILALSIIYLYKTLTKGELFLFSYWVLLVLFGLFSFQLRYYKTDENNISNFANELKDRKSLLKGVIIVF